MQNKLQNIMIMFANILFLFRLIVLLTLCYASQVLIFSYLNFESLVTLVPAIQELSDTNHIKNIILPIKFGLTCYILYYLVTRLMQVIDDRVKSGEFISDKYRNITPKDENTKLN